MERTKGPWTVVEDNRGSPYWHHVPYWRHVEIRAGSLVVAHVDCANAQGQGKANAAVIGAADEMATVLEMIDRSWRGRALSALPNYVREVRRVLLKIRTGKA